MRIQHTVVVFDAADISRESAFWAAVLGGSSIVSVQTCPLFSDSGSKVGQTRCARTHASSTS